MGSLSSSPKAPRQPQTIYVPAPTPVINTTASASTKTVENNASQASQSRTKSLLSRSRSRFGTIATSFKGLLGNDNSGARKTLLGE
ncbi:MAG: hypothetical protein COA45_07520 [Zetaproteobacteria bacterium]|nr:MAG: hypothetical protein COA45_07520 [Zetaproteobacteria bacterium]